MDIIIVGGGIAGLASAWALVKGGHRVTLIEQGPIPNPLSASGDEHRMIRRGYGSADGYASIISEGFEAWDEMWGDLGRSHYAARGILAISQTPGDDGEKFREGYDRMGEPYELIVAGEAARRWPFLDGATFRYATLTPDGGALLCQRIAADLATWLAARGAIIRTQTKVAAIDAARGRATLESGETLAADRIVVAAGAWVLKLVPQLADTLTIYRTALAYFTPPARFAEAWNKAPAILDIGGPAEAFILPPTDGTGLKFGVGTYENRVPASDPEWQRTPLPGEGELLRRHMSPPLAAIEEYEVSHVVTCAYTYTRDHCFLGWEEGKMLVVSACSGHGYKFGAAVGRRVAQAIGNGDTQALVRWLRAEPAF